MTDPLAQLQEIALAIQRDDMRPTGWDGSPFAWIRVQASRTRGKIGEQLVAGWCAAAGLYVVRAPDTECDLVVNGLRCEIKTSTRWARGFYKFQQLRDQRYDRVVCLGLSAFAAHCWVIPKALLFDGPPAYRKRARGLTGQHNGRDAVETAWLTVWPEHPPAWLRDCGGTLDAALALLRDHGTAAQEILRL